VKLVAIVIGALLVVPLVLYREVRADAAPAVQGGDEDNPAWSPDGKRLLFTNDAGHHADIYVVRADGTGERKLAPADDPFPSPSWSPDGKRIMFLRDAGIGGGIYVMNADGTHVRLLAKSGTTDPTWSPDGRLIAYSELVYCTPPPGESCSPTEEIYVIRSDGTHRRALSRAPQRATVSWSPDGTRIAFEAAGGLAVVDVATGRIRMLTRAGGDAFPVWSPNGKLIAFVVHDDGGIAVVKPTGKGMKRLDPHGESAAPAWSPDGKTLAYTGLDPVRVWVVHGDGSGRRTLSQCSQPAADDYLCGGSPAWSPDGRRVAFSGRPKPSVRHFQIWVVGGDGTGQHRISSG
jgi:Tol biopolymer transport system component